MPKAKKPDAPKINKSAWIRAQSTDIPAGDLLKKAKAEGIKLTVAQIYTTRSQAKKQGSAPSVKKQKPGPKPRAAAANDHAEHENFFRKLVLHTIGRARAQEILKELASIGL
jgi:hypothetical protein